MILDDQAIINHSDKGAIIQSFFNSDSHSFKVSLKPFRINYLINGEWVMEINSKDLLYFESPKNVESISVS